MNFTLTLINQYKIRCFIIKYSAKISTEGIHLLQHSSYLGYFEAESFFLLMPPYYFEFIPIHVQVNAWKQKKVCWQVILNYLI